MTSRDDLHRIAPAPPDPPPPADWDAAASAFHVRFPEDYMTLVGRWGAGTFDDFITVYTPGHPNPNLDLVHEAKAWSWALGQQTKSGERHSFPARIGVGCLLAWGATTNGDPCFWHLPTADPASWFVVLQEARGPRWHVYEGGLVDFLVAVLEGREHVPVFPQDFPSAAPRFVRGEWAAA